MLKPAVLFFALCATVCPAANLSLSIDASDPSATDPAYPGAGSTITTTTDRQTNVTVSVAGRNYGTLPLPGAPRSGLKAGPLLLQPGKKVFTMNGGFQPSAAGSRATLIGQDASFISISLSNLSPNTRFQNFSVELLGLSGVSVSNAWGASSQGGFANGVAPSYNSNSGRLTLNLEDFTLTGSSPLEIRLYGITGLAGVGDGTFTDVKVSASIVTLIPEPGAALLLAGGIIALSARRRRHTGL
ncbi:MAG TPA: PEP-CTERM sorting domain-containing protein [Verrucomicrobiales bacterium]|nr:PEP-CTERM sorting domain-containing protein [Verrucomicrobiales bacterium]